jgi:hypothetical protein
VVDRQEATEAAPLLQEFRAWTVLRRTEEEEERAEDIKEAAADMVSMTGETGDGMHCCVMFRSMCFPLILIVCSGPPPGITTITVPIPTHCISVVIGRGGEIVKRMQQITGARINVSRDEGGDFRDVIVSGRPEQCEKARIEIEQLVRTREASGGPIDPRQIGSSSQSRSACLCFCCIVPAPRSLTFAVLLMFCPFSAYPPEQGGYGRGPPPGSYGQQPQQYGPPSGYSSGYSQGPPQSQYGGPPQHSGAPQHYQPQGPPGYGGAPGYGAPAAAEEEAPVPPSDPNEFSQWWPTLSIPQQLAYYKKYNPEMLSQLPPM